MATVTRADGRAVRATISDTIARDVTKPEHQAPLRDESAVRDNAFHLSFHPLGSLVAGFPWARVPNPGRSVRAVTVALVRVMTAELRCAAIGAAEVTTDGSGYGLTGL
jgi:hypothetical protein